MVRVAFNGDEYLVREAKLSDGKNVNVAEEALEDALMVDGEYVSDKAQQIDEAIYCYAERDAILGMEKDEFDRYIAANFN